MNNKKIKKEILKQVYIYYLNKVSEQFLHQPLTPATIERMKSFLYYLQQQKKHTETFIEWQVPFIVTESYGSIELSPDLNGYELEEG